MFVINIIIKKIIVTRSGVFCKLSYTYIIRSCTLNNAADMLICTTLLPFEIWESCYRLQYKCS